MGLTFASAVSALDRPALLELLTLRPDLRTPVPHDLTDLASRAATESSARRALDRLDRAHLAAAEALAALGDPATTAEVADLLEVPASRAADLVDGLRRRALLWGDDDGIHLLRAVRTAFGPYPGGLATPGATPLTPADVDGRLAALDDSTRAVVTRLEWGPPAGALRNADRPLPPEGERSPVERLLAAGLLRVGGPDTVVLPREVALRSRGRFLRTPLVDPAPLPNGTRTARLVDHAGVGAAYELVHDVEVVGDDLGTTQPALLRSGGLGTRETASLGRRLGLAAERTVHVVELAHAAGLVATSGGRVTATTAYEAWLDRTIAERWSTLALAWRDALRWPSHALGTHALGEQASVGWAAEARAAAIAPLRAGLRPDPGPWAEQVAYARPGLARHISPDELVADVRTELALLGVVALDHVSALVTVLHDEELPVAVADLLPSTVETFVVQADLTAVAQGPLDHSVARVLRLLADQESRGGAGVFRFTSASVRRGFDAGWDAEAIERWITDHSTTGVPQPLSYLIGDVARVHGAIRVGRAAAYVRVEDPAQVPTILAHPRAGELGLRQVGIGALVADADPDEVVEVLRTLGLAPAAEDATGGVVHAPAPARTPARGAETPRPVATPEQVAATLLERAKAAADRALTTSSVLERLRAACDEGRAVEVAYVDSTGMRETRTMMPVHVAAGMVRLTFDEGALTLPLSRVSDVRDAT
ncbi:helicase-associated domain-containing protein [Mariniluteicoccus endophyticus]